MFNKIRFYNLERDINTEQKTEESWVRHPQSIIQIILQPIKLYLESVKLEVLFGSLFSTINLDMIQQTRWFRTDQQFILGCMRIVCTRDSSVWTGPVVAICFQTDTHSSSITLTMISVIETWNCIDSRCKYATANYVYW